MVFGRNVMGGHKNTPDVFGDFLHMGDGPLLRDLFHQLLGIKPALFGDLFEIRMGLHQLVVVHNVADIT
ncbi:hypothetical protein SDC9_164304 [bioreactor metagenome]|uniref:Uncharacterized protein n=1 Tax=bioreactor metagenome TaxID=1076179 RepID=A0A645FR92_9ZZZZ